MSCGQNDKYATPLMMMFLIMSVIWVMVCTYVKMPKLKIVPSGKQHVCNNVEEEEQASNDRVARRMP